MPAIDSIIIEIERLTIGLLLLNPFKSLILIKYSFLTFNESKIAKIATFIIMYENI